MMRNLCPLWPVAVLVRPLEAWPSGPPIHDGLLTQSGYVFHSTPGPGEHLVPLDSYMSGLPAWRHDLLPAYQPLVYQRLLEALQNPRPWFPGDNCQHAVTRVVTGEAQSRTMQAIGGVGILVGLVALLNQKPEPSRCRRKRR